MRPANDKQPTGRFERNGATRDQQEVIERLHQLIVRHVDHQRRERARRQDDARDPHRRASVEDRLAQRAVEGLPPVDHEAELGVFGLFGVRGAGKSTVRAWVGEGLQRFYGQRQRMRQRAHDAIDAARIPLPLFVCREPIDCSTLSPEVPLGISIAEHVHRCLEARSDVEPPYPETARMRDEGPAEAVAQSKTIDAWKQLLGHYVQTDARYRRLELQLAVSPLEFPDIAEEELRSRAKLRLYLRDWLDAALRSADVEAVLVILEDFDLAPFSEQQGWLTAFLDELQDPRLMLLVCADEARLEQRMCAPVDLTAAQPGGAGDDREQDDLLKRLLDKLIPSYHRVYLAPWSTGDVLAFGQPARDDREPSSEQPGRDGSEPPSVRSYLRALVNEPSMVGVRLDDLEPLVPMLPRGLSHFYSELRIYHDSKAATDAFRSLAEPQRLAAVLARAQGARSLARTFAYGRPLGWWASRMRWPARLEGRPSWRRTVQDARDGETLWFLETATHGLPDVAGMGVDRRVRWLELLINVGLQPQDADDDEEAVLDLDALAVEPDTALAQWELISRLPGVSAQLERCQFHLGLQDEYLLATARDYGSDLQSPWVRVRASTTAVAADVSIGWASLIAHDHNALATDIDTLFESLGFAYGTAERARQSGDLMPRNLRAMILLIDEVAALPWRALRTWAENQPLAAWLVAAAWLCAYAYLRVLRLCLQREVRRGMLKPGSFRLPVHSGTKHGLDAFRTQTSAQLHDELVSLRERAQKGSARLNPARHPMEAAAHAFFNHLGEYLPGL